MNLVLALLGYYEEMELGPDEAVPWLWHLQDFATHFNIGLRESVGHGRLDDKVRDGAILQCNATALEVVQALYFIGERLEGREEGFHPPFLGMEIDVEEASNQDVGSTRVVSVAIPLQCIPQLLSIFKARIHGLSLGRHGTEENPNSTPLHHFSLLHFLHESTCTSTYASRVRRVVVIMIIFSVIA